LDEIILINYGENIITKIRRTHTMPINFEKYANEGNHFIKTLAEKLGHPEEISRTGIILRSVMHTLRERITISQSFHIMAQLPMFLKTVYVDEWQFREKPLRFDKKEDFISEVEKHQDQYGEQEFNWEQSTEDIIKIVIGELGKYISKGEFEDIMSQLPQELEALLRESIHA
jgi:uncharacterized protein (DUF2267 family)